MADAKKKWKTAQFGLPVPLFADWRPKRSVRICGDEVQVQVTHSAPKPYYDSVAEYVKELTDLADGLIDDRLDFLEGGECDSSEIRLTGWRLPTDAERAIIEEGRSEVQWRDLTW